MSHVLSSGLASAEQALLFFEAQLALRTDPADLAADLLAGEERIVVIDTRSAGHYAEGHIPGAISFPHATMNPATTAALARDKVYVCYCDGIGCNGSTRGACKLAALGFQVKELIGGLHWWRQDGFAVATGSEAGVLQTGGIACGC
ncbi:TPA: rhodanese [Aeromonas hydrophila]|uniref:rhodanese-like domain-containing protein n=1 Tax=Aeromonas hydrophila TaxID=644 RepID=UPI001CCECA7E|nr:rhodanese-like domain-containing protein [Aeromonas hydrophila]UBQ52168.1 rhodanese [Aeromonas hydrophila]HDI1214149.1 rhodanese [Aeromonas hydrophila]